MATGTSLALGGASLGTNAFAVTGPVAANNIFNITGTLTRPLEPVVTSAGTNSGSVGYRYVLTVHSAGTTAGSVPMVNPFQGNTTLSGSNYNIIQTVAQPGCTSIDVSRTQPGALTTGLIGNVACGAVLNDTGLVGNGLAAPSSDTGSAGTVLGFPNPGPLVINTGAQTSSFGYLQVGAVPFNVPTPYSGTNPGWQGPLAVFTATNSQNNAIVLQAASGVNDMGIDCRHSIGTITNPTSEGSGSCWLAGSVFVNGINAWTPATFGEWGGAGGTMTSLTDVVGRWQWIVADGNAAGIQGKGMGLKGSSGNPSPFNSVALMLTNNTDFIQYHSGYAATFGGDDRLNFEAAVGSWQSGGTTYFFGPQAGSISGTLRPMVLTGASVGYNALATQAANTSFDGFVQSNLNAATSGNQMFSPRSRWTAQGWKTTSTAASESVDWIAENQPIQGTTTPGTYFVLSSQINGAGYAPIASFVNNAGVLGLLINGGSLHVSNAMDVGFNGSWLSLRPTYLMGFGPTGTPDPVAVATNFSQVSNGTLQLGTTSANSLGSLNLLNLAAGGTVTNAGLISTAAAPTVAAAQVGYGSTTAAVANCGGTATACLVINVAGTTRYVPYY